MVSTATSTEVTGLVERVGSYGFTLQGREGWISLSKFATPRPELPQIGDQVKVALDRSGYARAIDIVAPPATYSGGFRVVKGAQEGAGAPEQPGSGAPSKDQQIARMNALGHAVGILASGGMVVDAGQALELAAAIEAWIVR